MDLHEEIRLETNTLWLTRFASVSLICGGLAIMLLTEYAIPGVAILSGGCALALVPGVLGPIRN